MNFAKVNALNPALMEEGRANARRTHAQSMRFVEEGAGVESLNARPFGERSYGECAWPLGPKADRSCCNPVVDTAKGGFGASYCSGHLTRMLSSRQPNEKALRNVVSTVNAVERIDLSKRVRNLPAPESSWDTGRAAA